MEQIKSIYSILKPKSLDDIINDLNKSSQKQKDDKLIYYSIKNDVEKVLLLLNYGANVNAKGQGGWSSLRFAAFIGHLTIISILKSYNVNIYITDNDGISDIFYIEKFLKRMDIVELLMKNKI